MLKLRQIVLCLGLWATASSCLADYRVDLIVTLNRNASPDVATTHGMAVRAPMPSTAIDISDKAGLQRAGISLLPEPQFGLDEQWRKLRNSAFRPILRMAWRIAQRPTATIVRLHDDFRYQVLPASDPVPDYAITQVTPDYERWRLDGTVVVQQSAGLRVSIDLDYTLPVTAAPSDYPASNTAVAVKASDLAILNLRAEKRVNLGQLHFFDHPLLGVLVRVSQAD